MKDSTKVVGLDVSDKWTQVCEIARDTGGKVWEGRIRTTRESLGELFSAQPRQRIALEVGPHSPWMSRQLEALGHEVLVCNASKVALIYRNSRKTDRVDAETLARLARLDPRLLHPLHHRSASAQADLAVVLSREVLVRNRSRCIAQVRGVVKSMGDRLPKCSAEAFARRASEKIPEALVPALAPIVEQIASLTRQIRAYDRQIEELASEKYPESQLLRQLTGVGPITALAYVLVLEDKRRFAKSRQVAPFLGLVPRLDSSGQANPQLRITKEGNEMLRRLLVNCAQYILGPFGPDCDLRRYGEAIAARGGSIAKRKAVVAVARKLAVLLHHLWVTAEVYDPFFQSRRQPPRAA